MENGKPSRRVQKIEKEIREQIATFLLRGFKHALPGVVTVTKVMMSKDLRAGKVYVAIFGAEAETAEVIETLNANTHQIQQHLSRTLRMKFCPKLFFFVDDTSENLLKVEELLHRVKEEREDQVS